MDGERVVRSEWPLVVTCAALVAAVLALAALRGGITPAAPSGKTTAVEETTVIEESPVVEKTTVAVDETTVVEEGTVFEEHVVIELRVWQHVDEPEDVRLSARMRGGSWDTLGKIPTIAFRFRDEGWASLSHRHRELEIAGIPLQFWQRQHAPELFYVRACPVECRQLDRPLAFGFTHSHWSPLGTVAIPLDDGYSPPPWPYRHGGVALAVPVGNPGLAADREYLLALRDALAGTSTLNWSPATPTGEWEGVRLAGAPPRVSALDLAGRGLDGEVLGWLGDLGELRELRLDGNRLTGALPSKLAALTRLTHVYLSGNDFAGCVPPPLRSVAHSDLALLRLPDCEPPERLRGSTTWSDLVHRSRGSPVAPGTYRWPSERGVEYVLDLPAGPPFDIYRHWDALARTDPIHHESCTLGSRCGIEVVLLHTNDPYRNRVSVALDLDTGQELERSHYREEDPALSAILDRIAASVWANPAVGDSGEWVWP